MMQHRYVFLLSSLVTLSMQAQDLQRTSSQRPGNLRKSGLPEKQKSVTIPLKSTFSGYFVDVQINGKPVELLLDTGGGGTLLTHEAAKRIGLNATNGNDAEVFDSLGKTVKAAHAVTNRIDLGGAWTKNEKVWIISTLPPGHSDGILGINTLADWDVRIDPSAKNVTFFSGGMASTLEGESVVPLTTTGFQALRVPAWVGGQRVAATPATGYSKTVQLPSGFANKFVHGAMKEALPSLDTGVALSGKVASRSIKIPEFTFGPDTLRRLPANVIETEDTMVIIGLGVLRHYILTFRFSAEELRLKPIGTVQDLTQASTAGLNLLYDDGGRIIIQSVVPGGPGTKVGLQAGDELLEIEGHPLKTMKPDELASFKQLPPGTTVKIRYRRGKADPLDLELVLTKD